MGYMYDHSKGTFIDDTTGADKPVRKPNAVPPKTKTIKKFKQGGAADKPLIPNIEKLIDLYEDPQEEDFKLKYNPNSGLYTNKVGSVSARNAVDATKINNVLSGNDKSVVRQVIENSPKKISTWDLMKATARDKAKKGDYSELRELRKVEKKYKTKPFIKKISNTDQQTLTKQPEPIPSIPIDFFKIEKEKDPVMIAQERAFKKILQEQEKKKNKLEGLAYLMGVKE